MILLTFIIISLINKKLKYILYAITPLAIVFLYIANIMGYEIPFPYNAIFFPMWIFYYVIGMIIGNKKNTINLSLKSAIIMYPIGIVLQIMEGQIWNYFNNYNMATTQIKLSNFITNIGVIFIISNLVNNEFNINKKFYNILITIGDYSFGIYLTHMILVSIINKVSSSIIYIPTTISILLIEYFGISLCYKLFNNKILKVIGLK